MIALFSVRLCRIATAITLTILLASITSCDSSDSGQEPLPNIVVILADDLGYGDLSGYGATRVFTPNCDLLIQEGMKFTDAYAGFAVCTPTRYSLLTGRYAWRGDYEQGVLVPLSGNLIERERETLASFLQDRGYSTGCEALRSQPHGRST